MSDAQDYWRRARSVEDAMSIIHNMYHTYKAAGPVVFLVGTISEDANTMSLCQAETSVWVDDNLDDPLLGVVIKYQLEKSIYGEVGLHAFSF